MSSYTFNDSVFDPEDFGNEIVIINTITGSYYTIGGSATHALRWFFAPVTSEHVDSLIHKIFPNEVSEATTFWEWMKQQNLIIPVESSGMGTSSIDVSLDPNPVIHDDWTYSRFDDMADLIRLDPIHDVSDKGWPHKKP
jgi:hypothetical protein